MSKRYHYWYRAEYHFYSGWALIGTGRDSKQLRATIDAFLNERKFTTTPSVRITKYRVYE